MGLDMYLSATQYLWGDEGEKIKQEVQKISKVVEFPIKELSFEIGYWRKANQIHKWFVDNVQDGNDDCGTYYVPEDQLKELLRVVNDALQSTKPEILLPAQSGFFFGSTEYDEYYINDLKETKEIIEKYFAWDGSKHCDLHYHSSW